MFKSRLVVALGVVSTALAGLGAGVVSAHGGPVFLGVVHSCVNNSTGEVRLVKADYNCAKVKESDDDDKGGKDDKSRSKGWDEHERSGNWSAFDWMSGGSGGGGSYTLGRQVVTAAKTYTAAELNAGATQILSVACPAGKVASGGGGGLVNPNPFQTRLLETKPSTDGWSVIGMGMDPEAGLSLEVFAVCVNPS